MMSSLSKKSTLSKAKQDRIKKFQATPHPERVYSCEEFVDILIDTLFDGICASPTPEPTEIIPEYTIWDDKPTKAALPKPAPKPQPVAKPAPKPQPVAQSAGTKMRELAARCNRSVSYTRSVARRLGFDTSRVSGGARVYTESQCLAIANYIDTHCKSGRHTTFYKG